MACIFTQNVTLPQVFFKHFACKNQLPGLSLSGALVENGLKGNYSECEYAFSIYPAGIYLLKVNNRNTRTRCEICSKLTIKILWTYFIPCSSVSIFNFEHVIAGWVCPWNCNMAVMFELLKNHTTYCISEKCIIHRNCKSVKGIISSFKLRIKAQKSNGIHFGHGPYAYTKYVFR